MFSQGNAAAVHLSRPGSPDHCHIPRSVGYRPHHSDTGKSPDGRRDEGSQLHLCHPSNLWFHHISKTEGCNVRFHNENAHCDILGHRPEPGRRRATGAARTQPPPSRAPSPRRPPASPFLSPEVGARRTEQRQRFGSRSLLWVRASACS